VKQVSDTGLKNFGQKKTLGSETSVFKTINLVLSL